MLKAFKYRIYPTAAQAEHIDKQINACRFVYNLALETKTYAYKAHGANLSTFDLIKQITGLRDECPWLKEVSSQSLGNSIQALGDAYKRFFDGVAKFPRFKKKMRSGSYTERTGFNIAGGRLYLPKIRSGVLINSHRPSVGEVRRATVTRTETGKYFVSLLFETHESVILKPPVNDVVGIDLGLKSFLVTSDGQVIDSPRHFKRSLLKLKYIQSRASRFRGKRTRKKVAAIHEKVANQRKDFLHKVSTSLIRENQSIAIETLAVKNMVKNHTLARAISDAGWGMFVDMLEYKSEWYGVNLLRIGRFEPSSKTCSCCGVVNKDLSLADRSWTCACGAIVDRDLNAAINIKNFALKNLCAGRTRKNRKELPTMVGATTSEALIG